MSSTDSMQQSFVDDNANLLNAAQAYATAEAEQQQAWETYKDVILKKLDSLKSADAILLYLQAYVFQNASPPSDPNSDACIFGIFGNQTGLYGKQLQVNSYLTAVHNDLQTMVNSNSSDTQVVYNVATDLDTILDELKGNPALQGAMDPSSLQNMQQNDLAFRQQFYIAGDPDPSNYNPPVNTDPTTNGYTYHFTYGEPSPPPGVPPIYSSTFAEMQTNMQQPGDFGQATEGYQALTNALNSDTSMTQTINSALNEQINQLTNVVKALMGFYQNALIQPEMQLIKVAIQNYGKQ